jgi:hypothetical protein
MKLLSKKKKSSTSQPPPTKRAPRTPSPSFRPRCEMGYDCPHRSDEAKCSKWHPSKPKKEKPAGSAASAPTVPAVADESGKSGQGGKSGKGGTGGKGMANGWFVEVVSPDADTALLSIAGPGGVPEQSAASAAAA